MSEEKHPSFWTTLPGILTGLGTLIGAIGGVYIGLRQLDIPPPPPPTATPTVAPTPTSTATPTPTANPTPTPNPTPTSGEQRIIFTQYAAATTYLEPDALQASGIAHLEAVSDGYCGDAQPVILPKGTYQVPVNFLSTASPDQSNRCNGVPLRFELVSPVREVKIHFSGATVDYRLRVYTANGTLVGERVAQAEPYVYSTDYTIQYGAPGRTIQSFEFGYATALTIIREIELQ
jgi:hypothetical protein